MSYISGFAVGSFGGDLVLRCIKFSIMWTLDVDTVPTEPVACCTGYMIENVMQQVDDVPERLDLIHSNERIDVYLVVLMITVSFEIFVPLIS